MIDARDPAASYGVTIAGMARVITGESSQKFNAEIHRKYLTEAALADPKVGPVFAAWDDVTVRLAPASVIAWDYARSGSANFRRGVQEQPYVFAARGTLNNPLDPQATRFECNRC